MSEQGLAPIKLKVRVGYPPPYVWGLWTMAEGLCTWLAPEVNVEQHVGGAYELFWDPDDKAHNSTLGCQITAWEPVSRLAFTWRGPERFETLMPAGSTDVEVRFAAEGQETVIYLTHTGWASGPDWEEARSWQAEAWKEALGGLKALVEMAKHVGGPKG